MTDFRPTLIYSAQVPFEGFSTSAWVHFWVQFCDDVAFIGSESPITIDWGSRGRWFKSSRPDNEWNPMAV